MKMLIASEKSSSTFKDVDNYFMLLDNFGDEQDLKWSCGPGDFFEM